MQSAALLEAVGRGEDPYPILRVTWEARGYSLGTGIYASAGRHTDAGQVTGIVAPGGWEAIECGSGIESGELLAVETRVGVVDPDNALMRMLETYDPRGSAAAMDWAAPGLVADDWEPIFRGVIDDWEGDGLVTRLYLKTDDTVLRSPVPPGVFGRSEWSSAYDATIFGTHLPLVLGVHDSYKITGRGMVPAVNIRYDKDFGYWWLASVGHMVDIRRIYYDGEPVTTGGWSIRRGIYGSNRMTIIEINEGFQPEEGVVVSFDGEGPDADGLTAGASVTNPVRCLRAALEEYTYRTPPLNGWRGDHSSIDDTSWDAVETYFTAHGYDTGMRFGGDQNSRSAAELIQSFLDSHPWVRIWWTPLGKLAIGVLDHDDVDPDATAWLDIAAHHEGGQMPYGPGDRREVYTQVNMPFLYSNAEQKFLSAYEAHDVAALEEKVVLSVPNDWSQARFDLE